MPRVIVALHKPDRAVDLVAQARLVAGRLAADPRFAAPPIAIATFEEHIDALYSAEAATLSRAAGTAKERDARRAVVASDLDVLATFVQGLAAKATLDEGREIVAAAGLHVKNARGPSKPSFRVNQGPVSGTVRLYAKAAGTRASYDWQYAPKGGAFVDVDPTVRADTTISGLTRGAYYEFRVRRLTKGGMSDWSDVVTFLVE